MQNILNFVFKGLYRLAVSESASVGMSIGKIMAYDNDIGENAEMDYSIEDDSKTFAVITNNETQEGIIILKKVDALKLFVLHNNAKSNQKYIYILCNQLVFALLSK